MNEDWYRRYFKGKHSSSSELVASFLGIEHPKQQVVRVGRYEYAWYGLRLLEVGDRVLLPSNAYFSVQAATVTEVGIKQTYVGSLSEILECVGGTP